MNATALRASKIISFMKLYETVYMSRGKVKNSVKKKLEAYRLPLEAMNEDPLVSDIAKVALQQLDQSLEYCKDSKEENRMKMFELNEKIGAMIEEMTRSEETKNAIKIYQERG